MTHPAPHPLLPYCPSSLAGQLLTGGQRILLYGEAGIGKITLAAELARILSERGLICFCIGVDLPEIRIAEGLIVDEPLFCVRTITLDHGTPVQAYAFESKAKFSVDKNALKTLALDAGPWLNQLKQLIGAGDNRAIIRLPDNSSRKAGELGTRLPIVTPGEKLVYATDLADTTANRALAHKSDIFFCEASFLETNIEQARRTGHLTARACDEIATGADVKQLVPNAVKLRKQYLLPPGEGTDEGIK